MAWREMEAAVTKAAVAVRTPGALAGPGGGQVQADIKKAVQCVYDLQDWNTRLTAVQTSCDKWEAIAQAVALLDEDKAPEDLDRRIVQVLRLSMSLAIRTAHVTPRRNLRLRVLQAGFVGPWRAVPFSLDRRSQTLLREMMHSSAAAGDRDGAVALAAFVRHVTGRSVLWPDAVDVWATALVRTVRLLKDDTDDRSMSQVLMALHTTCGTSTDPAILGAIVPFMCDLLVDERLGWCIANPEVWPTLVRLLDRVCPKLGSIPESATTAMVDMVRRGPGTLSWAAPRYWRVVKTERLLRLLAYHAAAVAHVDVCNMVCTVFGSAVAAGEDASLPEVMDVVCRRDTSVPAAVVGPVCSTRFLESAGKVLVDPDNIWRTRLERQPWALCMFQFAVLVVAVDEACKLRGQLAPAVAETVTSLVACQHHLGDFVPRVTRAAVQALVPLWCYDLPVATPHDPVVVETLVVCMRWSVLRQRWCAAVFRGRAVATLRKQAHVQKRRCK